MKYGTILRTSALLTLMPVGSAVAQQNTASGDVDYPRIRFGMDAVTVWQALEHRNDPGTLPDLSTGVQAALGNVHLNVALADGIDVYAEFYLSSNIIRASSWIAKAGCTSRSCPIGGICSD